MLEIKLIFLLCICAAFAGLFLIYAFNCSLCKSTSEIYITVSADSSTENIEDIVRGVIFRSAEYCCNVEVILIDYGADDEIIEIFQKMLDNKYSYKILKLD